ncbi:MAG: hypothetical protein SVY53_10300 [Chloroflexota bacterium]|nr:hypothetical protein [Chloroflexota bacterium]
MSKWMCSECGYTADLESPPEECPSCNQKCSFNDVTCYIPECGGERNIDPRLAEQARKKKT